MVPRLLLLAVLAGALAALDLSQLPSPRPAGWTVDASRRLSPATIRRCDAAAQRVADAGLGELAIVVVPDCGGAVPHAAALALFNRWGIGHAGRDDGVLLLVALAERRSELLLGKGIDDDANVARTQAIVDGELVPRLRQGDLDGAVAAGAEAARLFLPAGTIAAPAEGRVTDGEQEEPATMRPAPVQPSPMRPAPTTWPPEAYATDHDGGSSLLGWIIGGGAVGGGGLGLRWWLRRRPRRCPQCAAPLHRLDEVADDAYLEPGQRTEERIGSVDYDVWVCSACPHVEVSRYGAWFTSYHRCPGCGARTASDRTTTITAASESFTGLERIDTRCVHCGHSESRTRVTPRLTSSSSSSSGSSFGSSSSGGGSSSSSSSGFSGGSSSGRGGGGSW